MPASTRFVLVGALFAAASSVHAQTVVDPSGHWKGTIEVPEMPVTVEVDLVKD